MAKTSTGFFGTSNQTTGGFLDDVDATAQFRAVNFDRYTSVKDVPGILVTYTPDGGEPREEFYPVGHAQKITARKDGSGFEPAPARRCPPACPASRRAPTCSVNWSASGWTSPRWWRRTTCGSSTA